MSLFCFLFGFRDVYIWILVRSLILPKNCSNETQNPNFRSNEGAPSFGFSIDYPKSKENSLLPTLEMSPGKLKLELELERLRK